MLDELDRYYTPEKTAEMVLSLSSFSEAFLCVDPTCGAGHLLAAASKNFASIECIGIDRDRETILQLRKSRPEWTLSIANLLNPRSYNKTAAVARSEECDLLLLNPPFSHGAKKFTQLDYQNTQVQASVAMAYILKSIEIFDPNKGAIAIVPESLLYSETDSVARSLIERRFNLKILSELECKTFKGARVHSIAIELSSNENLNERQEILRPIEKELIYANLIRGSVPVYRTEFVMNGIPFIHTTDLRYIDGFGYQFKYVPLSDRSIVSGWNILFPRVGMPNLEYIKPVFFDESYQISDCVFSLMCLNEYEASAIALRIRLEWLNFQSLYRGTGARYVTVIRLKEFLMSLGVLCI